MTKISNSDKRPIITIVVPAYNVSECLDSCLESLVKQTCQNIEIICVDDGSTDGTHEKLLKWAKKDNRIKVLQNPSKGVSSARNCGIDKAQGEYLMFCDSDDSYVSTTCEDMLNTIETSGAGLAICEVNLEYYADQDRRLFEEEYATLRRSGLHKVSDEMFSQINVWPINKIFRMSVINKYNLRFPEGRFYEDAYFSFAYLYVCKDIYFLKKTLYNYVRRANSTMSTTWSRKDAKDVSIDHVYVIIALHEFLKRWGLFEKNTKTFWEIFRDYEAAALSACKSSSMKKRIERLVAKFIRQHKMDFKKAEIGVSSAIIDMIPSLRRRSLPNIKRSTLKFLPTFQLQVYSAERLEGLIQRNNVLLEELKELVQEIGQEKQL